LLDLIVALLGDQLVRAALRRGQAASFLRRLVSEPGLTAERAREEASVVGLDLPAAYWPAVLSWGAGPPAADIVERIDREARRLHRGGLTAASNGRVVLLHPGDGGAPSVMSWLEQVVARARSNAPHSRPHVVAGEESVALEDLGASVARLRRLSGYGPGADPGRPVVTARQYALERLLGEALAPQEARSFVEDLLGRLIAWDREHGSDLLRVLEANLDSPRHDQAAHRCYMHRNTFRLRLRKALQVLGDDLEDPGIRLAVHVALKLRHVTARTTDRCGPSARDGAAGSGRRRPADAAVAAAAPPARR
jgi:sugar diacid utilization regulator